MRTWVEGRSRLPRCDHHRKLPPEQGESVSFENLQADDNDSQRSTNQYLEHTCTSLLAKLNEPRMKQLSTSLAASILASRLVYQVDARLSQLPQKFSIPIEFRCVRPSNALCHIDHGKSEPPGKCFVRLILTCSDSPKLSLNARIACSSVKGNS